MKPSPAPTNDPEAAEIALAELAGALMVLFDPLDSLRAAMGRDSCLAIVSKLRHELPNGQASVAIEKMLDALSNTIREGMDDALSPLFRAANAGK